MATTHGAHAFDEPGRRHATARVRTVLLACGIVSTVLYAYGDAVALQRASDHGLAGRTISDLSALGAPTRAFLLPLLVAHQLLVIGFASGVWTVARHERALRASAGFLFASVALGIAQLFVPMPDTLGIGIAIVLLGAVGFGAAGLGKRFRYYSIATLVVMVLGLVERAGIYAAEIWIAVLAIALLRRTAGDVPGAH